MRKIFLLFSVLVLTNALFCKNRTAIEAAELAGQFLNQSVGNMQKAPATSNLKLKLAFTSLNPRNTGNEAFYYIFNKGNSNGYVIISGDDRTKTVLGYTDEGIFDISVLPENIKGWLNFYENEIKSLPDSAVQPTQFFTSTATNIKSLSSGEFATSINPLLGNIKWNQGEPYNNLCPIIDSTTSERAATGCIATGMAQVMKYHNWPSLGIGSNTYTSSTLGLSLRVDFSKTQYDWSNMTDTYSSSNNEIQNNAVATLMYHCGVAANMNYGKESGTGIRNMALALRNNFNYDSNLELYYRDYYILSEWINLLKTELNSSRPILYSGIADNGSHLFVCDGYDSNGLFHFNWGWGGVYNGYFVISALDPSNQGNGSSTSVYNSSQIIVTGLQKPSNTLSPSYKIYADQPVTCTYSSFARRKSFTITAKGVHQGINPFIGNVGLALYNDNGLVQVIKTDSLNPQTKPGFSTLSLLSIVPMEIANGNYRLYFVYKCRDENNWQNIRGKAGTANYLNIAVDNYSVTISRPSVFGPALKMNSLSLTGNLYQNKTGRFNASITNSGLEYNSRICIYLQSTTNSTIHQFVTTETINIAANETRTIYFSGNITLNPGKYSISVMYDPANSNSNSATLSQLGNALTSDILTTPTESPTLTLTNNILFPNPTSVEKSNAVLTAKIKNTSGFFDNKLIAFIYPKSEGSSVASLGYQSAIFDQNEERTVTFSGPIDLASDQYKIEVNYLNASNVWTRILPTEFASVTFTLVDNQTAIQNHSVIGFEIYPNPVENILLLKTDLLVNKIIITDLLGKQLESFIPEHVNKIAIPVDNLKSGTYLVRIQTENETKTSRFIKK